MKSIRPIGIAVALSFLMPTFAVANSSQRPPPSYGPDGKGLVIGTSVTDGLDDWTSNTPDQVKWKGNGGHPGGFVYFSD